MQKKILDFINKGSKELTDRIAQLEKDKKESPVKRLPPRTRGNIQGFVKQAAGGGGVVTASPIPTRTGWGARIKR